MAEVPRVLTPVSEYALARALAEACEAEIGEPPGEYFHGGLWAMAMHETGKGESVWCFNLGNISTWGTDPSESWFRLKSKHTTEPQTMKYVAFPCLSAGAAAFVAYLRDRHFSVLEAMAAADPNETARRLKLGKYYSGLEVDYARALRLFFAEFLRRGLHSWRPSKPPPET